MAAGTGLSHFWAFKETREEGLPMRTVQRIVESVEAHEGAGFVVRRPFPTTGVGEIDPFLLIDELGPVVYRPGEAVGAPNHPHRGFETVTYILDGEVLHED